MMSNLGFSQIQQIQKSEAILNLFFKHLYSETTDGTLKMMKVARKGNRKCFSLSQLANLKSTPATMVSAFPWTGAVMENPIVKIVAMN